MTIKIKNDDTGEWNREERFAELVAFGKTPEEANEYLNFMERLMRGDHLKDGTFLANCS